MEITQKQEQEIDFLIKYFSSGTVTSADKEDYINHTVLGIKKNNKGKFDFDNPLFQAKRSLDISIKLWQEDLFEGLLGIRELLEDFNHHPYAYKVLDAIRKTLIKKRKQGVAPKQFDEFYKLAISNQLPLSLWR